VSSIIVRLRYRCDAHSGFLQPSRILEGSMLYRLVLLAAGSILLAANQSTTAQTIMGAGTASCGEWLRFRSFDGQSGHLGERAQLYQLHAWVDGFISGTNIAKGVQPDILSSKPSGPAMYAVVDNYCRANPLDNVASGAIALANELQSRSQ
jgi:hypothetical protein